MMKNINKDYLVTIDVTTGKVICKNMYFTITDRHTCNIFFQLVFPSGKDSFITKYAPVENAEVYNLVLRIIKPNNDFIEEEVTLLSQEDSFYEIDLPEDCKDFIGKYTCELFVECTINHRLERITSNEFTYIIGKSIASKVDGQIIEAPTYSVLDQLENKLNGYIEDYNLQVKTSIEAQDARLDEQDKEINDFESEVNTKIEEHKTEVAKEIEQQNANIESNNEVQNQNIAKFKESTSTRLDEQDKEINDNDEAQNNKIDAAIESQNKAINNFIDNTTTRLDNQDTNIESKFTQQTQYVTDLVDDKLAEQDSKVDDKLAKQDDKVTTILDEQAQKINDFTDSVGTRLDNQDEAISDNKEDTDNKINNLESRTSDKITTTKEELQKQITEQGEKVKTDIEPRLAEHEANIEANKDDIADIKAHNEVQDYYIKGLYNENEDGRIEITTSSNTKQLPFSTKGFVDIQEIQGNTVIMDSNGNITDTIGEGCTLCSVGELENNTIKIKSTNCPVIFGKGGRLY